MRARMNTIMKLLCSILLFVITTACQAQPPTDRAEVARFIDEMSQRHGFDKPELKRIFNQTEIQQSIIDAISRPAESKPWYQYRPIFVTTRRIRRGVEFWDAHRSTLQRAEAEYGIPAEIITAIIGVETFYGRHEGGHRVLDSLVTLAFEYPPRSGFFRSELEEYLLLTREEGLDPLAVTGSYAGAMGQPQFISSSYRTYAVDFDGDGKRNLLTNTADAIGSVANYLNRHGWQPGQAIAAPARVDGSDVSELLDKGIKPQIEVAQLPRFGVTVAAQLPENARAALIQLEQEDGYEYWLGLKNFYVITRYNHSPLYAMAVYQLSQEIKTQMNHEFAAAD